MKGSKIVDKNDNVVSFAGNIFSWTNTYWGHEEFFTKSFTTQKLSAGFKKTGDRWI